MVDARHAVVTVATVCGVNAFVNGYVNGVSVACPSRRCVLRPRSEPATKPGVAMLVGWWVSGCLAKRGHPQTVAGVTDDDVRTFARCWVHVVDSVGTARTHTGSVTRR